MACGSVVGPVSTGRLLVAAARCAARAPAGSGLARRAVAASGSARRAFAATRAVAASGLGARAFAAWYAPAASGLGARAVGVGLGIRADAGSAVRAVVVSGLSEARSSQ